MEPIDWTSGWGMIKVGRGFHGGIIRGRVLILLRCKLILEFPISNHFSIKSAAQPSFEILGLSMVF